MINPGFEVIPSLVKASIKTAIAPATCGLLNDVPVKEPNPPLELVEVILSPNSTKSGLYVSSYAGPLELKKEISAQGWDYAVVDKAINNTRNPANGSK